MFARTKRLTLRPGWPEDAPMLTRAIAHREVVDKLATAPWPYALGDAESFLRLPQGSREPRFLAFESPGEAPRLIGGVGIAVGARDGAENQFGYWVTPDAWGRGYATEMGRHVIAIARHALGLTRLHSGHFVDNPASGHVLTKLGFRPTGQVEPRRSLSRGSEVPCALFELDLSDGAMRKALMAA